MNRRSAFSLAVLALSFLLMPLSAPAQQTIQGNRYQQKLLEGERHLRRGNPDRARRVFEELLEERPESREAFSGWVRARVEAHDLEGLEGALRSRIPEEGGDSELRLLLGDVYAARGEEDSAAAIWRSTLPLFEDLESGYAQVGRRMEERRMIARATELFLEGRVSMGGAFRFAEHLGRLYELAGDGEKAADEWVRAAAAGTVKSAEVLRRIHELRQDGLIDRYPTEEAAAVLDSLPSLQEVRAILAEFHLYDGRCGAALHEYGELERSDPRCGGWLLPFAKAAYERRCFSEAAQALLDVVDRCDRPSVVIEARFLLAQVYRGAGQPKSAADVYERIAGETRNPSDRSRAELGRAEILLDDIGDAEGAIPILRRLADTESAPEKAREIRFILARAYLVAGRLEEASQEHEAIYASADDDAVRERAIFGKATVLFYSGDPDGALAEYRRIVDQFPHGRYLNDALSQSIFISENRDAGDGPLQEFAQILLLLERKAYDKGRAKIEELLDALVVAEIRDDLVWQLGRIEEEEGRYRKAIEVFEGLARDFPESRLAERARIHIGDIYSFRLGDIPSGIEQYNAFLVNYPQSVFSEEVKRKKREVEQSRES